MIVLGSAPHGKLPAPPSARGKYLLASKWAKAANDLGFRQGQAIEAEEHTEEARRLRP